MGVNNLWLLIRHASRIRIIEAFRNELRRIEDAPDRNVFSEDEDVRNAMCRCVFEDPSFRRMVMQYVSIPRVPTEQYASLPLGMPLQQPPPPNVVGAAQVSVQTTIDTPKRLLIVVDGNAFLYKHLPVLHAANVKLDAIMCGHSNPDEAWDEWSSSVEEEEEEDEDGDESSTSAGGGGGGVKRRRRPEDEVYRMPMSALSKRARVEGGEGGDDDLMISFSSIISEKIDTAKRLFTCKFRKSPAAAAATAAAAAADGDPSPQPQQREEGGGGGRCTTYDEFFKAVFSSIAEHVEYIVTSGVLGEPKRNNNAAVGTTGAAAGTAGTATTTAAVAAAGKGDELRKKDASVSLVIVMDGVPNVLKWRSQINRRFKCIVKATEAVARNNAVNNTNVSPETARVWEACKLTAYGDCILHLSSYVNEVLLDRDGSLCKRIATSVDSFTVIPPSYPGEGEVKMIDVVEYARLNEANTPWDVVVMSTEDSDALLQSTARLHKIRDHVKDLFIVANIQSDVRQKSAERAVITPQEVGRPFSALLDLRSIPGAHTYNGFFHIMDDIVVRLLGVSKEKGYVHPFQVVVPLLMFGGMEVLPYMAPPMSSGVKSMRLSSLRNAIAACCNIADANTWIPIPTTTAEATQVMSDFDLTEQRNREVRRQKQFKQCLITTMEQFVPTEKRTTTSRYGAIRRSDETAESLMRKVQSYLRVYYWATLYCCGDKNIRWYGNPEMSHAIWEQAEEEIGRDKKACVLPMPMVLNYLKSNEGSNLNLCSDMCVAVNSVHNAAVDVRANNKFLNAMFMYSMFRDDFSQNNLNDLTELRRIVRNYEASCICTVNSNCTHDPRDVMTIQHVGAREEQIVNANDLLHKMYVDCIHRLTHMPYNVNEILEPQAAGPQAAGPQAAAGAEQPQQQQQPQE